MFAESVRKNSLGRRISTVSLALVAAVVLGLPSAALGMEDEPAGKVRKVRIEGVVVRPIDLRNPTRKPITIILGETETSRRRLVTSLSARTGSKASTLTTRSGTKEVERSLTSRTGSYDEWPLEGRRKGSAGTSGGIVVLDQALSILEISCPREVSAGAEITIEVTGVGDADDIWDVWLVYPLASDGPGKGPTPDGSRYEQQTFKTGAKTGGADKLTATFATFSADKGKLLGVCIERRQSAEKRTLWVQIR